MDCDVCKWKDIKYRCIGCNIPICNVCAVACSDITPGYCEERYLVSKCEKCSNKRKYEGNVTPVSVAVHQRHQLKQAILSSFFAKKVDEKDLLSRKVSEEPKNPSSKKPWNLLASTHTNNWKLTSLAEYVASEQLVINSNKTGFVTSLRSSLCKAFAERIEGKKHFSYVWAFQGTLPLHN